MLYVVEEFLYSDGAAARAVARCEDDFWFASVYHGVDWAVDRKRPRIDLDQVKFRVDIFKSSFRVQCPSPCLLEEAETASPREQELAIIRCEAPACASLDFRYSSP